MISKISYGYCNLCTPTLKKVIWFRGAAYCLAHMKRISDEAKESYEELAKDDSWITAMDNK